MRTTMHFSPWILKHKSLILPLIGGTSIAQKLNDQDGIPSIGTLEYEDVKQPESIKAVLKPHQLQGVSFLQHLRNNGGHGMLADEMGLGKTLQVLSFFQLIKNTETRDGGPFLVICPLSVMQSWQSEITRWTSMKAVKYHGDNAYRQTISTMVKNEEAEIVLTTYETLINDTCRLVRMACWRCLVLDEGHRVKNSTTKLTISVHKLRTQQRIILTGTPIQNDLREIWVILNWLYPDIFVKETLDSFKGAFLLAKGKFDCAFLENLKRFLDVIMLRRVKESTAAGLEIPPKKEVIIHLPLTELQKRLYLKVLTGVTSEMDCTITLETPPASPSSGDFESFESYAALGDKAERTVLNIFMELRKICVHPLLVQDAEAESISMQTSINDSSKFIFLRRLLEREVNQNKKKMLIFSGFNYALDCCQMVLENLGIEYVRLDGGTSCALRKYNVHRFMNQAEYQVFIMATRAGGEGITLTAAEVVVFLDMDFNPQVTAQAEARAHRMGQTKVVTVYKICTRGTVEDQMINRIDKKLYLASKVLESSFNDVNADTIASDSTFIMNIINRSRMAVSGGTAHPEQLLTMQWTDLLEFCTKFDSEDPGNLPSPPQSPSIPGRSNFDEQEKAWLARSGRIQTRLFDGRVFRRPPPVFKYDTVSTEMSPAERRINKSRVVFDEEIGYWINKESTQCKLGEAVPTLTSPAVTSKQSKVPIRHLKACMICGKYRNLAKCMFCPHVFHDKCVEQQSNSLGVCPKHRCSTCNKTAKFSGGLLFACTQCPKSYCIDCVDLDAIKSLDEFPDFETVGYEKPSQMQYIVCQGCNRVEVENEQDENVHSGRLLRKRKRD